MLGDACAHAQQRYEPNVCAHPIIPRLATVIHNLCMQTIWLCKSLFAYNNNNNNNNHFAIMDTPKYLRPPRNPPIRGNLLSPLPENLSRSRRPRPTTLGHNITWRLRHRRNYFPKYNYLETKSKTATPCVKIRVQQNRNTTFYCTRISTHVLRLLLFRRPPTKQKRADTSLRNIQIKKQKQSVTHVSKIGYGTRKQKLPCAVPEF